MQCVSVGLRPAGVDRGVPDAELEQAVLETLSSELGGIVGHDALEFDAPREELVGDRASQC